MKRLAKVAEIWVWLQVAKTAAGVLAVLAGAVAGMAAIWYAAKVLM